MAKIPLVAFSVTSAAVLFVGTSAALLAAQGRLGALFGKPPAEHADAGPGESRPAGGPVLAGSAHGASEHGANAPGDHGAQANAAKPNPPDATAGERKGAEPAAASHETAAGHAKPGADEGAEGEPAAGHGALEKVGAASAADAPPRVATASLVRHFSFPEPFTGKDLEDLTNALRESQRSHQGLAKELAVQRAANDRDRADYEARFAELDALRKRLDQDKAEVTAKVAELTRRNDQLVAGEEKFVRATVARISSLKVDEAKTFLLELEESVAARVLQRMEDKLCAKILASLPAEKRVALMKQLRALSLADEQRAAEKTAADPR